MQLQSLMLGNSYTEEPNPPAGNVIVFADDLSGQGNEFRLMMVNELEHNYPNGQNNPHGVVAVDILWDWYLQYTLD